MVNVIKFFILFNLYSLSFAENLIQHSEGQVFLNKITTQQNTLVKAGDEIRTGLNGKVTVLFEEEVYKLSHNTTFLLPNNSKKESTSSLVTGTVLAAFKPGKPRKMKIGSATTLTVRGTGIYARSDNEGVHYCLCYGHSTLASHNHSVDLDTKSKFHKDLIVLKDGMIRTPKMTERKLDHTSRENIELEKLLNRPSPFGGGYRDFVAFLEGMF